MGSAWTQPRKLRRRHGQPRSSEDIYGVSGSRGTHILHPWAQIALVRRKRLRHSRQWSRMYPNRQTGDCGIFIIEYLLHILQSRSALKSLGLAPHQHWFGQVAVSHRRKRMHWIAKRLQSEAQKRSDPDVGKLLKDKTIRAAVLWALRDTPKQKRSDETAMENGGPNGGSAPASSARGSVGVQARATMASHASACTELTEPWAKRPRDSHIALPKRMPRLVLPGERENPMLEGRHFAEEGPEHAEEGEPGGLSTPGSAFALLSS